MRKPYGTSRRLRRAGAALLVLTALLLPFYAIMWGVLAGRPPENAAQTVLHLLVMAPVAEVALLACNVVLLQKAAHRNLPRLTARLALDAAVLIVFTLIHTAIWFVGG